LIILIANAHPSPEGNEGLGRKDQLLEINTVACG